MDLMIGNIYVGDTPHGRYSYAGATLQDMLFLDFEKALLGRATPELDGLARARLADFNTDTRGALGVGLPG